MPCSHVWRKAHLEGFGSGENVCGFSLSLGFFFSFNVLSFCFGRKNVVGAFWGGVGVFLNPVFLWCLADLAGTQPSLQVTQSAIRDSTCCRSPGSASCSTKKKGTTWRSTQYLWYTIRGNAMCSSPGSALTPCYLWCQGKVGGLSTVISDNDCMLSPILHHTSFPHPASTDCMNSPTLSTGKGAVFPLQSLPTPVPPAEKAALRGDFMTGHF